jgi:pyruvate formate lyase activating enzyme
MGCRNCVSACPNGCHVFIENRHEINRSDCIACGKCTKKCFSNALAVIGRTATVGEVTDEVMKDSLFYNVSGGGMTLSGGEPMFQPEFTLELLKAIKGRGIHTCIETCGFCAPEHLVNSVPYTDLYLFDLKTTADVHGHRTGVPLGPILRSLYTLDGAGGRIILRCPLIPGVNMNNSHMENIARIAESLKNITAINLEPYHPIGISKCEAIGREQEYADTEILRFDEAEKWAEKLRKMTNISVTVV